MKILAVCSYPREAAATRFRLEQFAAPLRERGIDLDVHSFLDGPNFKQLYSPRGLGGKALSIARPLIARLSEVLNAGRYDLLLVQREAMPFGPAVFEWLYRSIGRIPMVLDLDDATYVRYVSPSYGRLGSAFKFFGKTDKLIDRSELVICGNRFIADYIEKRCGRSVVLPTIVDQEEFRPVERKNDLPVIGWIGTHSTFPFLERLFPILSDLGRKHRFKVKVVGAGRDEIKIDGVGVENLKWELEREIADFQSLDVGLYPIDTAGKLDPAWLAGKSGFKAIQYMAVGVPFVMSPVGVCAEIGREGETHFNAATPEDWYNSLDRLLSNPALRAAMGEAARRHSLQHYGFDDHVRSLAEALRSAAGRQAA